MTVKPVKHSMGHLRRAVACAPGVIMPVFMGRRSTTARWILLLVALAVFAACRRYEPFDFPLPPPEPPVP